MEDEVKEEIKPEDGDDVERVLLVEPISAEPAPSPTITPLQEVVADEALSGKIFARVVEGVVAELMLERRDINEEWHPSIVAHLVDVTDHAAVQVGWIEGNDGFVAPPPYEPTPEVARNMAFDVGAKTRGGQGQVRTYSMSPLSWRSMTEVATHVSMFNEFPGGAQSFLWPSDPPAEFSDPTAFLEEFKLLSSWRAQWNQHVAGNGDAPPDVIEA